MSIPWRRLLVIDDQPDMGDLIQRIAEPMGYEVTVTQKPEQAVSLAGQLRPDIIILDILMPGKDGIEIVQEMARMKTGTAPLPRLVLISGESEVYLTSAAKIARGFGWTNVSIMTKPARAQQLRDVLSDEQTNKNLAAG